MDSKRLDVNCTVQFASFSRQIDKTEKFDFALCFASRTQHSVTTDKANENLYYVSRRPPLEIVGECLSFLITQYCLFLYSLFFITL